MYSHRREYYSPPPDRYRSTQTTPRYSEAPYYSRAHDRDYEYERSRYYDRYPQHSRSRDYSTGRKYDTDPYHDTDRHYLNPRGYSTGRDYYDRAEGYPRGEIFGRFHRFRSTRSNNTMGNSDTILVYHHRLGEFRGNPLVNKNPGVVTRGELNYWLKHNPEFQATTKRLTTRHPTIYQRDLLTADQVAGFGSKGNYDQDRAEVRIELIDYYLHRYRELTIISHAPSKHGEN